MKIAVLEHKVFNDIYSVVTGKIEFSRDGLSSSPTTRRLNIYSKDYGVDNYPCNIDTLSDEQKKTVIDNYIDNNGCFLSSKAFELASKLQYRV